MGTQKDMADIYFSDFFSVDPDVIEEHGAFNISLVNDLPLFIDPFFLFNSQNTTYQILHSEIINYMRFLKDESKSNSTPPALIREWFTFHEIKQNWLGFSESGNSGRGLGPDFAKSLYKSLSTTFRDFGEEDVTKSSHIEKLCLIKSGVGRDNISDFTTNLILSHLANFTQDFAHKHLKPSQRKLVTLRKVKFNYSTRSWTTESFELPYYNGDFVLLTPKNILTKDETWINRTELLDRFPEIANALPNEVLREQINDYLRKAIPKKEDLKQKEIREVMSNAVDQFPQVLDYYIRDKEENGERAVSTAVAFVREVEELFVLQIRSFVSNYLQPYGFYHLPDNTHEDALRRVMFMKDVIENKGGHKIFYLNGKPIQREADLHIMYRLTWFATVSDVTREANDGRGPADYKISRGAQDKTIVEFKLAKNTQLERNLAKQCEIYEKAGDTTHPSIKVILYFDDSEFERVQKILKRLDLEENENVVLIDASDSNKPSGSHA